VCTGSKNSNYIYPLQQFFFLYKKVLFPPHPPIQALRYSVFTSLDIITMHYNILHITNSPRSMSSVGHWSWAC